MIARAPAGDRIEFGVFMALTLRELANHAGATVGVDSFHGMPEPSEKDKKDGMNPYPKGRFRFAISEVKKTMQGRDERLTLVEGFVPQVLPKVPGGPYAFAHLDMDQFYSTRAALEWLWPRLIPGAIVCCDDYIAGRDWLAAGAIDEFCRSIGRAVDGVEGQMAWIVK